MNRIKTQSRPRIRAQRIYNGMPARELGSEGWQKPWSGGNGGNCLEAMKLADGRIAVRQSTDPDRPALIYTPDEMTAFIEGAKAGRRTSCCPEQTCLTLFQPTFARLRLSSPHRNRPHPTDDFPCSTLNSLNLVLT